MTTDIIIRTNGNYVAEGTLSIANQGGKNEVQVRVGPGSPAEQRFHVPHGSSAELSLTEREATPEERSALATAHTDQGQAAEAAPAGGPVGDFQNGEFVERVKGEQAKRPHRED